MLAFTGKGADLYSANALFSENECRMRLIGSGKRTGKAGRSILKHSYL